MGNQATEALETLLFLGIPLVSSLAPVEPYPPLLAGLAIVGMVRAMVQVWSRLSTLLVEMSHHPSGVPTALPTRPLCSIEEKKPC